MRKTRVLCLDIEGGFGGSSRSLYESIYHMNRDLVEVTVWCKKPGVIQDKYSAIGVATAVQPDMPKITALPRLSRNILLFLRFFRRDWPQSNRFRRALLQATQHFDVVHFNHEGLFWLARWLRRHNPSIVLCMHRRTMLKLTWFARWQVKVISQYLDELVFITENEQLNHQQLHGRDFGQVIYNIVPMPQNISPLPESKPLVLATLANYDYIRGVDLLVDVAVVLQRRGVTDVRFLVAGRMTLSRSLPGVLGEVARRGGDLSDYATKRGVENYFQFLGHVSEPEKILQQSHVLLRPSRENNPWGRDVLEAMSYRLPIVAAGSYDRFIKDNQTGFLLANFEPEAVADKIMQFIDRPALIKQLGQAAYCHVATLCSGVARAEDLRQVWGRSR